MEFNIDMDEYSKQLREELLNTRHSVRLEAIVPPIDLDKKPTLVAPYTARTANDGCNAVTVAMLLYTLELYIKSELEKPDIKLAYKFVNSLVERSVGFGVETKEGEKNDK